MDTEASVSVCFAPLSQEISRCVLCIFVVASWILGLLLELTKTTKLFHCFINFISASCQGNMKTSTKIVIKLLYQ